MNFFVLIIEMNEHSTLPKLIQKFIWNTEVLKVVGANEYERTCWLRSNPGAMLEIDKSERLIMEFINEQRMRIMNGVKEMKYKEFLESSRSKCSIEHKLYNLWFSYAKGSEWFPEQI